MHQGLLGGGQIASNKRIYPSPGDGFDEFVFFGELQRGRPGLREIQLIAYIAGKTIVSAIVRLHSIG
jgi:hypothetical protein